MDHFHIHVKCVYFIKNDVYSITKWYIHLPSSLWFIHFLLYSWFPLGLYYLKHLIWQMYQSILIDPDFNNSLKHTIRTQNKQVHVSYTVFSWFGFSFHYLLSYDKIKMQNAYIRICNNKICIVMSLHFWFRTALRWISPPDKCRRFLLHAFVTKTRHSIQQ